MAMTREEILDRIASGQSVSYGRDLYTRPTDVPPLLPPLPSSPPYTGPSTDRPVFNVKDYGAKGTTQSSNNDLPFIQRAEEDAAQAGGVLFFPGGGYRIPDSIWVHSNVALAGVGSGHWETTSAKSIIYMASGVTDRPLIRNYDQVNGNSGIGIYDLNLILNGDGTVLPAGAKVLDFRGSSNTLTCKAIRVERCAIGGGFNSIYLSNVQESWFDRNKLYGAWGTGITLNASFDNVVSDNQIGVHFDVPTQLGPANANGIDVIGGSPNNIIRNNFAYLCDVGLYVVNGPFNVIIGNRLNTNGREGILFFDQLSGAGCKGCAVTGNVMYDNGNRIVGAQAGITVDQQTKWVTLTGNICADTRAGAARKQITGIRLAASTSDNVVVGNICFNNTLGQIIDSGTRNRIGPNVVDSLTNGLGSGNLGSIADLSGTGTPEGAYAAGPGSTFRRTDGAAGSTFYYKGSGTGNTGWVAVA